MGQHIGNFGENNTGSNNIGKGNAGDNNVGDGNAGSSNVGSGNAGSYNFGDFNCGNGNYGNGNIGTGNEGDSNIGFGNSGDGHIGVFNSGGGSCSICAFNKPVKAMSLQDLCALVPQALLDAVAATEFVPSEDMTKRDKNANPYWRSHGGYLGRRRDVWDNAWAKLTEEDKRQVYLLPNFDEAWFFHATGIDLTREQAEEERAGKKQGPGTIVIDGKKYRLTPA